MPRKLPMPYHVLEKDWKERRDRLAHSLERSQKQVARSKELMTETEALLVRSRKLCDRAPDSTPRRKKRA